METNQIAGLMSRVAEASTQASEYCILGLPQGWATCMTKAEWSGWMQAIGALLALAIAIALPWSERRRARREIREKLAADAGVVLRFYSELLETNDAFLDVAIAHLPGGKHERHPDVRQQVLVAIHSLRSMPFEQLRTIGFANVALAGDLADFHCEREKLVGVLERNGDAGLAKHLDTVVHRVEKLKAISDRIKLSSIAQ